MMAAREANHLRSSELMDNTLILKTQKIHPQQESCMAGSVLILCLKYCLYLIS